MVGKIIKTGVDPPLDQIGTVRIASKTCRLGGSVAQSSSCARDAQGVPNLPGRDELP